MGRQVIGNSEELLAATAANNGAPVGDQAGRLVMATDFPVVPESIDWLIRVELTTTAGIISADLHLWGRDKEDTTWGTLGNNDGQMNGGVTIAGTDPTIRYFVYQDLGVFQDLWLEVRNLTGIGETSVRADIYPIYNYESAVTR